MFLFIWIFYSPAQADLRVIEIMPPSHLRILEKNGDGSALVIGQRLLLRSQVDSSVVGYAIIQQVRPLDGKNFLYVADVLLHERHALIAPGDIVQMVRLDQAVSDFPGRGDLLITGSRRISSRYKRLAYFGSTLGDGHPLDRGEKLVDITTLVQYGVTSRVTVGINTLGYALKVPNASAKVLLLDGSSFAFTTGYTGLYSVKDSVWTHQARGLLSTVVNTKTISHTIISVARTSQKTSDQSFSKAVLRTELQTAVEYIMDSWDRVIFGPTYNIDLRTLGGFVSYVWIWNQFHFTLGLQTQDVLSPKLDPVKAYTFNVGAYWRF